MALIFILNSHINIYKVQIRERTIMKSRRQIEESTPYSEHFYHHIEDYRTQAQKLQQHQFVQSILKTNIDHFQIAMTEKTKVKYDPKPRIKVQLGDGWYCYITDNQLNRPFTILTIHGAPGDHRQWAGLQTQMEQTCRWINLTIPGFDQEDQRRGTYNGTSYEFAQLIIKLITKLGLKKIVYCGHSFGTLYGSYFITYFPQYVQGYINLTGLTNTWSTGILLLSNLVLIRWNFNNQFSRPKILKFSNKQRQDQHKRYISAVSDYTLGETQFPGLTITEYFACLKIFNSFPNGISQGFKFNRNIPLFRVVFYGKNDSFDITSCIEQAIYYYCKKSYANSVQFKLILKLAKSQLQKSVKQNFDIKQFNCDHIQQYFCYYFQNTGHNAHKRRPKEISKIIKIYLCCLSVLNKYKTVKLSKL